MTGKSFFMEDDIEKNIKEEMGVNKLQLGLQLFTVRHELEQDYQGTLEQVKAIGYEGVEVGYNSLPAQEQKKLLSRLQLQPISVGASIEQLEEELENVISYAQAIDCPRIGCFYLPLERRSDQEGYRKTAHLFNRIGEACQKKGLKFFYHHHDFEFQLFEGKSGLDILLDQTNPAYVYLQLDTYWAEYGGEDPLELLKKWQDRVILIHLKDMEEGSDRAFAEVGQGILDLRSIIDFSNQINVEWLIVEQDVCNHPPLESIKMSMTYLKRI